jgi:catechol 2,3-dioxygenase-like lactoylglutathione lyase family enzyme
VGVAHPLRAVGVAAGAAMNITRTDFVFLPITSFAKAEEFYGDILGLECSERYDNGPGGEFETGSLTLQLVDVAKLGRIRASKGALALHVADLDAARAELDAVV